MINYMKQGDVEEHDTLWVVRISAFAASTLFFISILVFSIQDILYSKNFIKTNLTFFILIVLGFVSIGTSIIMNLAKLNEIKTGIDYINKKNELLNIEPENFSYSKTLWIFPLVSFIYGCIFIVSLIVLNYKCNIINTFNDYYRL